jgi:hypothetical protein
VAWVEPSDRVIVPSEPVTPVPAVTGPISGGQKLAQEPLQFDVVEVSGANQYSVKPLALVKTVALPIFALFTTAVDDAEPEVGVALDDEPPELPEPVDELPHAARVSAMAAKPTGANHLKPMACLHSVRSTLHILTT